MFTSMSGEGRLSGRQSSPSPIGHGVTSPGLDSQESSWIGLLSVVSRSALALVHKYLPGRPRAPVLSDIGAGGDLKNTFIDEGSEFLIMPLTQHPAPHVTYLRCQHEGAAGLLEPSGGSTSPWLAAGSLREMGIQGPEETDFCQQSQIGFFSSVRTVLSPFPLSSVSWQEIKPTGGKDWVVEAVSSSVKSSGGRSWTRWGSFWGGGESSQKGLLSDVSWAEGGTGWLCPQQLVANTKAPAAGGKGWTLGENTGPTGHKEQPANTGGLPTVQNREGSTPDHRLTISDHLSGSGAAAACSEVALPAPDLDNGYSSLEEEHFQMCQLYMAKAPHEDQPPQEPDRPEPRAPVQTETQEEASEEGESTSGKADVEEQEAAAQEAMVLSAPQCQNKTIAFIMGCPCSDDDSSQSDGESSDDDDDGFDSEGSSDLSDSTDEEDEDDEDSDSEADSEAERLWRSLSQSLDPYNPRNFTARMHTSSTPPRTIPTSTPPSSAQSTPASSPLSSPPSGHDVWDDSTSASEVDEAESLRLWSSFSCSSDPYSPFNFQAPLRTQERAEAGSRARARKASQTPPHHNPASPPEYRKEEAEERLDSGFSEPSTSSPSQSCSTTKKVRFCDDVEEFFASCGEEEEDRRGPWEELARDRCRFLRRCQEVEQSIAYCLQPQHRSLVSRRLAIYLYVQDA